MIVYLAEKAGINSTRAFFGGSAYPSGETEPQHAVHFYATGDQLLLREAEIDQSEASFSRLRRDDESIRRFWTNVPVDEPFLRWLFDALKSGGEDALITAIAVTSVPMDFSAISGIKAVSWAF